MISALIVASPASFAQAASTDCDSGVKGRVPILLVHGYNSSVATWHDQSKKYLAQRAGTCVATIDYAEYSTDWVTNAHIGPAVATKILDLANKSSSTGGTGKVIVIGHSMGALAIRCAASPKCSGVDGVAQHILEAITFGSPNQGSFLKGNTRSWISDVFGPILSAACYRIDLVTLNKSDSVCKVIRALGTSTAASAFTPGSDQQNALPAMPDTIPVYAIAGSVKVTTTVFAHFTRTLGDGGDLVVDENSALASAKKIGQLGGKLVVNCGELNVADLGWAVTGGLIASAIVSALENGTICNHVKETNDPTFLAAALAQITQAVPPPPGEHDGPNLHQIAAGNYTSLLGKWTDEAWASNPHAGTGVQWHSGGTHSLFISAKRITDTDNGVNIVNLHGRTLTSGFGSYTRSDAVTFKITGGYLEAPLVNENVAINWFVAFFPKEVVDLNSHLGPNNGVTLDNSKNTIYIWTSNNSFAEVFEQV